MNKIRKGWCLECGKSFSGNPNASLCPDCTLKEFKKMDNGDLTGYLYTALRYETYLKTKKEVKK